MNASSLIASFATGTYTVTRQTKGSLSYGKQVSGTTSTFTIAASVSPVSGRDLLKLPEGFRADVQYQVFTTTELYTSDQQALPQSTHKPDTISVDGMDLIVEHAERWQDSAGNVGFRYLVRDGRA